MSNDVDNGGIGLMDVYLMWTKVERSFTCNGIIGKQKLTSRLKL
jgi:hypothetical protein